MNSRDNKGRFQTKEESDKELGAAIVGLFMLLSLIALMTYLAVTT